VVVIIATVAFALSRGDGKSKGGASTPLSALHGYFDGLNEEDFDKVVLYSSMFFADTKSSEYSTYEDHLEARFISSDITETVTDSGTYSHGNGVLDISEASTATGMISSFEQERRVTVEDWVVIMGSVDWNDILSNIHTHYDAKWVIIQVEGNWYYLTDFMGD